MIQSPQLARQPDRLIAAKLTARRLDSKCERPRLIRAAGNEQEYRKQCKKAFAHFNILAGRVTVATSRSRWVLDPTTPSRFSIAPAGRKDRYHGREPVG